MKKQYEKAKVLAKNLPSGSYAAGCPTKDRGNCFLGLDEKECCKKCERSR